MTAVSKNVCFDVLDDIVDNYNNILYRITGVEPIDVKSDSHAGYNINSNGNDPKFKVGDHLRILKYKTILKDILQIGLKKFLLLAKLKIQVHGLMWLVIYMVHSEKELQETNYKEFKIKKIIKKKMLNYLHNRKDMILLLIVGLVKWTLYKNASILS